MSIGLPEVLNSINLDKQNLLRGNPEAARAYPAFVVARSLSYHQPLIPLLDQLNELRRLDNLSHYEFLLYTVPKAKRFAKWSKPEPVEDLEFIARMYECSTDKARQYLSLLNEDQITQIRESFDEGGSGKKLRAK